MGFRVIQALLAQMELQVYKEYKEIQGLLVHKAFRVIPALLALQGLMAHKVLPGLQECKDLLV